MDGMSADDGHNESFEEKVRAIARELGRSAERMSQVDIDQIAESFGIDADKAKDWADTAGRWLRGQVEHFGDDFAGAAESFATQWPQPTTPRPPERRPDPVTDPLRSAGPHPLDLPSDEQGAALAALESGRWTVEAGTNRLTGHGDGEGPSDALGLVRELHARDWIDARGHVTLVGRSALGRWLQSATHT
jgi:hypothetical protein